MLGAERIDRKLPGALVGLVGSTLVVGARPPEAHGVAVLGTVAHDAPQVGLTDLSWSTLGQVFPIAGVVALVVVSQSAATTRAFADQGEYPVDVNRDFVGVGASGSCRGCSGPSPPTPARPGPRRWPRPGAAPTVRPGGGGGRDVLVVPAAGLLTDVPLVTLAAILIYVATRIFHVKALVAVLRFDKWEFALAMVTLVTVALVGVEQGIGVAVGLAILDRTRRSAHPLTYVLGKVDGTTSWEPLGHPDHPVAVPGVVVVTLVSPLYYANADHVRTEIRAALRRHARADVAAWCSTPTPSATSTSPAPAWCGTLLDELDRARVTLAVARAVGGAPRSLSRSGLGARIGRITSSGRWTKP